MWGHEGRGVGVGVGIWVSAVMGMRVHLDSAVSTGSAGNSSGRSAAWACTCDHRSGSPGGGCVRAVQVLVWFSVSAVQVVVWFTCSCGSGIVEGMFRPPRMGGVAWFVCGWLVASRGLAVCL